MNWFALILSCSLPLLGFANIGPRGFSAYRNEYFVETGTCGGGSLLKAVRGGFRQLYSIDIEEGHVEYARNLLRRYRNVTIVQGDSATQLWELIKGLDEPITFWLDAHVFPPHLDGGKNCPLLEELEQIRWHPIKTHTILIDDLACCGKPEFDFLSAADLIRKILEINPEYQITTIDGGDDGEAKNNVLVATPPD